MLYQQIPYGGFFMNTTAKRNPKAKHTPHARKSTAESTAANFMKALFKSISITLGIGTVLLISASLAAYFYVDPATIIRPLALSASALTAFTGGIVAARMHQKSSALACGLRNGGILIALMILISLFLKPYASGYSAIVSLILHAAFLLLSVIGATVGKRSPQKKRHTRK